MAGRAFLAKLGLVSLVAGSAASLSVAVGTEQDAANRVGFYSDLTPAAEQLGVVVGGVDVAEFTRIGLDLTATLGNVTRLSVVGRVQFRSSGNTDEIAWFGHAGFNGVRWGGTSQGVVLESSTGVANAPNSGNTFMSFFCDSSALDSSIDIGKGIDRTNRLSRPSAGGYSTFAVLAVGRDVGFTTTTRTLFRVANRNPTASLTLTGGARYVEVADRDTTLNVTTDIFAIEADRSVHVYTTTDASSTMDAAFHVAGGVAIEKATYIGGDLVPLGNQTITSNVVVGLGAYTLDGTETNSVVVGKDAGTTADYTVVIGDSSYANNADSVVIGDNAYANSSQSVLIGSGGYSQGQRSVAIGAVAYVEDADDIVIGGNAEANGTRNIVIGSYAFTGFTAGYRDDMLLLGYGAASATQNLMQIGGNRADLTWSVKVGNFQPGDVIVGSVSGATAIVVGSAFASPLEVAMTSAANFVAGDLITGSLSGSTATIAASTPYVSNITKVRFNRGVEPVTFSNPFVLDTTAGSNIDVLTISEAGASKYALRYYGNTFDALGLLDTVVEEFILRVEYPAIQIGEAAWAVTIAGSFITNGSLTQALVTDAVGTTLSKTMSAVKQTAGGITTTLWAAPVAGDTISVRNAGGGAANTIDGNGTNIEGAATFNINDGESVTLIYDGTQWTVF